jgi:hypothetical protein
VKAKLPPDANPNAAGKELSSRTKDRIRPMENRFIPIRLSQPQEPCLVLIPAVPLASALAMHK